jgi:hypothetical protein
MQEVFILFIFIAAVGYLGNLFRNSFFSKKPGCNKGCGSCGGIDFDKIEQQMKVKELTEKSV